tara:strand:- start:248 stop:520 length:273 start_codon:yes stop_codon:yes gene_type:complete
MIRYLNKKNLIELNDKAIKNKKNRTLEPHLLNKLSDTLKFPIVFSMVHNDSEIRAVIQISSNSACAVCLDIDFNDYKKIHKIKEGVANAT